MGNKLHCLLDDFIAQITDQFKSSFSSGLSLPQICENFIKAAHDPRISAVYLQIEPLDCGWGKVEEIRRHILNFRKSGNELIFLLFLKYVGLHMIVYLNQYKVYV